MREASEPSKSLISVPLSTTMRVTEPVPQDLFAVHASVRVAARIAPEDRLADGIGSIRHIGGGEFLADGVAYELGQGHAAAQDLSA
jgi:hypothetical protein